MWEKCPQIEGISNSYGQREIRYQSPTNASINVNALLDLSAILSFVTP